VRGVRGVLGLLRVLVVLVVLEVLPGAAAQDDGVIAGQVVDGVSGRPVAAAVVSISGSSLIGVSPSAQSSRILTGADGRFVFRDLAAGVYSVAAAKVNYADGEPGRLRPGGSAPPIVISDREKTVDVVVPMWKYGAIGGTILDEAGEPVAGVQVQALKRGSATRAYTVARTTFTDDRGAYRFGNLVPGGYLVVSVPPPVSANANIISDNGRSSHGNAGVLAFTEDRGRTPGPQIGSALLAGGRGTVTPPPGGSRLLLYPPTFYPGSASPVQASSVTIGSGDERIGVDMSIAPVPTARVAGILLKDGVPAAMTTVRLIPEGTESIPAEVVSATSISDADGRFMFAGVAPGRYTLRGTSTGAVGLAWVDMPLTVAGDDTDALVVMLRPPLRITARTEFDGGTPPAASGRAARWRQAPFVLEPLAGGLSGFTIAGTTDDRGISLTGYLPGRYRVQVKDVPPGWMLKGAMLNGVDVSDTPFDFVKDVPDLTFVFTDRISGVSGRVDGAGPGAAAVLLFPADARAWLDASPGSQRFRSARPNLRGEFGITAVPPGDYFVAAVPDASAAEWRDADSLESLARIATRVSIAEGERRILALRMTSLR